MTIAFEKDQKYFNPNIVYSPVLLHPGDCNMRGPERPVLRQAGSTPLPGCGGRLRGWLNWDHGATPQDEKEEQDSQEEAATHKVPKLM